MRKTNGKILGCLLMICSVLLLTACQKDEAVPLEAAAETAYADPAEVPEEGDDSIGEIVVYVCGEVNAQGVYELPEGSRLYQALEAAGGMTDTAADTYLNQAEGLSDGQSVYVPSAEEAAEWKNGMDEPVGSGSTDAGKVNINTANKEELMTLSGIGEAKALSIMEYRETKGRFEKIEDIKNIPGIKDGVFEKIKDQISI